MREQKSLPHMRRQPVEGAINFFQRLEDEQAGFRVGVLLFGLRCQGFEPRFFQLFSPVMVGNQASCHGRQEGARLANGFQVRADQDIDKGVLGEILRVLRAADFIA